MSVARRAGVAGSGTLSKVMALMTALVPALGVSRTSIGRLAVAEIS